MSSICNVVPINILVYLEEIFSHCYVVLFRRWWWWGGGGGGGEEGIDTLYMHSSNTGKGMHNLIHTSAENRCQVTN